MKRDWLILMTIASCLLTFVSCKKRETLSPVTLNDLYPLQTGKTYLYRLDSMVVLNLGSDTAIHSYLAKDIVDHFEKRQTALDGKAMIISMSRRIAVNLFKEIIDLRPEWHNDDLSKGVIKVVMTASSADGPVMAKHHTTKQQRRDLADRMRDPDDPLKLVSRQS